MANCDTIRTSFDSVVATHHQARPRYSDELFDAIDAFTGITPPAALLEIEESLPADHGAPKPGDLPHLSGEIEATRLFEGVEVHNVDKDACPDIWGRPDNLSIGCADDYQTQIVDNLAHNCTSPLGFTRARN